MRNYLIEALAFIACVGVVLGVAVASRGQTKFPPSVIQNVASDTDGDGSPDYIQCSDFDGDGTLEMADLRACYAALTDTSRRYLYVLPGDYTPDLTEGSLTTAQLQLGSNTTVECAGAGTTTLNGAWWQSGDTASQTRLAVIGNDDTESHSNIAVLNCGIDGGNPSGWNFSREDVDTTADTIDVEDNFGNDLSDEDDHGLQNGDGPFRFTDGGTLPTCSPACTATTDLWVTREDSDTIGLATTYALAAAGTNDFNITAIGADDNSIGADWTDQSIASPSPWESAGIFFWGVSGLRIEGNRIKHVAHSCIYVANVTDFVIANNIGDQCGGYLTKTGGGWHCIYNYADGNQGGPRVTRNGLMQGNHCSRMAGAMFTWRANNVSAGDGIERTTWMNNTASRGEARCLNMATAKHVTVDGLDCDQTYGVSVGQGGDSAYLWDNASDDNDNATWMSTLKNITLTNSGTDGSVLDVGVLQINNFQDQLSISNLTIKDGGDDFCIQISPPNRNLTIDGAVLERCGLHGIYIDGSASMSDPEEGITLRNIKIKDVARENTASGRMGIRLQSQIAYSLFENIEIAGISNAAIAVEAGVDYSTFRNISMLGTPPGWYGSGIAVANLPACDANFLHRIVRVSDGIDITSDAGCYDGGNAATNACMCEAGVTTGTADADSTAAAIQADGSGWATTDSGEWASGSITFLDGDLAGEMTYITSNDADTINVSPSFSGAPGSGDAFTVHGWRDVAAGAAPMPDINGAIDISDGAGTCVGNTFENITAGGFPSGWTLRVDEACTGSATSLNAIDEVFVDNADPMTGALRLAAGGPFLVNANTFYCEGNDNVCFHAVAGDDLAVGSSRNHASACDEGGACTNGTFCIDDGGVVDETFFVCVASQWKALENVP